MSQTSQKPKVRIVPKGRFPKMIAAPRARSWRTPKQLGGGPKQLGGGPKQLGGGPKQLGGGPKQLSSPKQRSTPRRV